jgi:hypothetical protein
MCSTNEILENGVRFSTILVNINIFFIFSIKPFVTYFVFNINHRYSNNKIFYVCMFDIYLQIFHKITYYEI